MILEFRSPQSTILYALMSARVFLGLSVYSGNNKISGRCVEILPTFSYDFGRA